MNIKGAIFDLDGTLLESMFIWNTIGEDYLKKRGIVPEKGLNQKFKTMSIIDAAKYYKCVYGITETIEEIISGVNGMIEHFYADEVILKDGVSELLSDFRSKGIKMCVATATDRYMVENALKRNKVFGCFCGITTCSEVGKGKNKPDIFEKSLDIIGTEKSETIVFEDSLYAIQTAKKAEFRVAAIYDEASLKEQTEIKKISDYYLKSFRDWSEL